MRKLATAAVLSLLLLMSGCSQPIYFWFVNATPRAIAVTFLGPRDKSFNNANGSPWYWPVASAPMVQPHEAIQLPGYCYDCTPEWVLTVSDGDCARDYSLIGPPPREDAPDWRLFSAYGEEVVQIDEDMRLYRLPARGDGYADATLVPQPRGYPLAPRSACSPSDNDAPRDLKKPD